MLQYLEDWDTLSRTIVTRIQDHKRGLFAVQSEVEALTDVKLNLVDKDQEPVWLEVPRLRKNPPPQPSEELSPWVVLFDDPAKAPVPRKSIVIPAKEAGEEPQEIFFNESVEEAFNAYLTQHWQPWSEKEVGRRRCIQFYEQLFQLKHAVEMSGTESPTEIVWGMGIAVWNTKTQQLCHPLLTQQVEIYSEEGGMDLRIRPTTAEPRLEIDPFLSFQIPELPIFEAAASDFLSRSETIPSPFETDCFEFICKQAAKTLDKAGRCLPDEKGYERGRIPASSETLAISDTWVLFARPRTNNFLLEDIKRLKECVAEADLEGAAKCLVEEPSEAVPDTEPIHFRGISSVGEHALTGKAEDLYFPKPFNDEQVEIIRRLANRAGVVVQGPPGTGKTHTIANVICHYLAHGKRVLVTSKGEAALAVLQSQIPEEIRKLTISILSTERDGKQQLENAVNEINSRVNTQKSYILEREIRGHDESINRLHERIAALDTDLRAWARANTEASPESIGGLLPEALAREVCSTESEHSWFPDALDERPEHEPAVTDQEMYLLAMARTTLGQDLEYIDAEMPALGEWPSPAALASIHEKLCEKVTLEHEIQRSAIPPLPQNDPGFLAQAYKLQAEVQAHLELIAHYEADWHLELRLRFREAAQAGEHCPIASALHEIKTDVEVLDAALSEFVATAITLPDFARSNDRVRHAINRSQQGKRSFSLFEFGNSETKSVLRQISLNGVPPQTAEEWKTIGKYCALLDNADKIAHRWNKAAQLLKLPIVEGSSEDKAKALSVHVGMVKQIQMLAINYDLTLHDRVLNLLSAVRRELIAWEKSFLGDLQRSLNQQTRKWELDSAEAVVGDLRKQLKSLDGSVFIKITEWIETCLGQSNISSETVIQVWSAFVREVERITELDPLLRGARATIDKISSCGATNWAAALRAQPWKSENQPLMPPNWREAWQWSRKRGYLQAIDGRAQILKATHERRDAEVSIRREYEGLVQKKTWLKVVEKLRLDQRVSRAITAYVQALRGMTKSGNGKRDHKLRQAAKEAMHLASGGVPCWIMPHWRVSESIPSVLGDFDLVIVDEASQSDAWALPSILRGKQILIVGDDKQVGPQPSFAQQVQIDQIQERLRNAGVPKDIALQLDPKASIYDLGELIFSGQTIRLREHFRCAEAIIEFCNKLCYDQTIKCLRIPSSTERLLPTLVDVQVKTGYRDPHKKINRPEAEAIVTEVASLIEDPANAKRSIGIVSLLGPEQAKLIMDLLLIKIGEEAFVKHRIRCGDARTFQGSEADIVFISAVDDANSGGVMTYNKLENIRRVNVAVSRARDRLYFFHSFAAEDLSALDLRLKLIEHFRAPIHGLSQGTGRDLCESNFEREMFDELTNLGYRVLPQVRAGDYRIDFVVEGHDGKRLAVECDGDRYHGPEKWMDDIHRQRLLERAGWKFWRCWGSSFARDKTACIKDLVDALEEQGIKAIGNEEVDFSGLVEFRVAGELQESDREPQENAEDGSENAPNPHGSPATPCAAAIRQTPTARRSSCALPCADSPRRCAGG